MGKHMTMRELLDKFDREVVPKKAGRVQQEMMKASFMAGVSGTLSMLLNLPEDDDESHRYLESVHEEVVEITTGLIDANRAAMATKH